jgi:hypothetical protein
MPKAGEDSVHWLALQGLAWHIAVLPALRLSALLVYISFSFFTFPVLGGASGHGMAFFV